MSDELSASARLRELEAERHELRRQLETERHEHEHALLAVERYRVRRDLVAAELSSARVEIDQLRAELRTERDLIVDQVALIQRLQARLVRAQAQCALPATRTDVQRHTAPQTEEPSS